MSNHLSIAAVTASLRDVLSAVANDPLPVAAAYSLADTQISLLPPDRAGQNGGRNEINLFLYQTQHNAALRNLEVRTQPGELRPPPVALNLLYLVTVHPRNDDELLGHLLLGRAVALLHEHACLPRDRIAQALPLNDLHEQTERVRLFPLSLSTEELFRIWSSFGAKYRLSMAYQAEVVLIDSAKPKQFVPITQRTIRVVQP
ncbi:MAG: DUF4255 domain-containing protein [Myxococcales bacterium]|nr:DUF4255 domain-containing protein [Myxococcales bacterium]